MRSTAPSQSLSHSLILAAVLASGATGCQPTAEVIPLAGFSKGSLSVEAYYPAEDHYGLTFEAKLFVQTDGCPVLPDNVNAWLNGSPITRITRGQVWLGESSHSCQPIEFTSGALPLKPGESPAEELVISDGSYAIRLVVNDLRSPRSLTRLTPLAEFQPGAQVRYDWQPATDTLLNLDWHIDADSDRKATGQLRFDSGSYVTELPSQPWPAESRFEFLTSSKIPAARCEGVASCSVSSGLKEDNVPLPLPANR